MKLTAYGCGVILSATLLCPTPETTLSAAACETLMAGSPAAASSKPAPEPADAAPSEFRAIYLTYWSAATPSRLDRALEFAREGLINSVVVDVKDVTGTVAFDTSVSMAGEIGAKEVIIRDLEGLIGRFHDAGLYVIARLVVFSDPKLAEAEPGWAVHSTARLEAVGGKATSGTLWRDRRNLAWIDPSVVAAWDYNLSIARDALSRGFDEINFDYIRFPSDGILADMSFPIWNGTVERHRVIRAFFGYLRREMGSAIISADLFGLSTVNRGDLGVGQVIEDAVEHFDYVCPMVYPSHYAVGFIGKPNPAKFPYEVVYYSLKSAKHRLNPSPAPSQQETAELRGRAKLRPWLQSFHLGARYTPEMVVDQVRATRDSLGEAYTGFLLWNPGNQYHKEALHMVKPQTTVADQSREAPPGP